MAQEGLRLSASAAAPVAQESLRLVSHSIAAHDGRLPRQYTAEGQGAKKDMSPALEWYGVPEGTRSLALVAQDIDADPAVPWTHWVVANIPPDTKAQGPPRGVLRQGGRGGARVRRPAGGRQRLEAARVARARAAVPRPPHPVQALRARRRAAPRQQGDQG